MTYLVKCLLFKYVIDQQLINSVCFSCVHQIHMEGGERSNESDSRKLGEASVQRSL